MLFRSQAITFVSYGLAAVVLAVRLAGRFLKPAEDNAGNADQDD